MLCLVASTRALDFSCSYDDTRYWGLLGFAFSCTGYISLDGSETIERVRGIEFEYTTVDLVYIGNQNMPFIPKNLGEHFPSIRELDLIGNNIAKVTAEDLKQFSSLTILSICENRLTSIDGDLFKYNLRMQSIDFTGNQILQIGTGLVDNLKYLTNLHFYKNPCINKGATGRTAVLELASQLTVFCPPKSIFGLYI